MLMRFHLFMGLMIVFLAVAPGWTADPISGIRLDQPLEITSGRLEVFQNEQKTVFSDQVEATQKDFRLNTDRLTVYYDKQQSRVERLEAEGHVRVVQQDRSARSDQAEFNQRDNLLILKGHAELQQGANRVSGQEIIFDLEKNTSVVKSSGDGRVRAIFTPPGEKGSAQ